MPTSFSVYYRNPGHWDIYDLNGGSRKYRIRGQAGNFSVLDEDNPEIKRKGYATVNDAMSWICSTLMVESQLNPVQNEQEETTKGAS